MAFTNKIEEKMQEEAKFLRYPLTVRLELLPICNLKCKMCYIESSAETVARLGGLKTVEDWLELAEQLLEANTLYLLLTGGEVFLYPRFRELYEKLYDMGFLISINTNATMIDADVVEWLAERPPKCVSISLYGASDATYYRTCGVKGMFDRVDRAIQLLLDKQINVECKTVMTPLNVNDMEELWRYVKNKGIPYETANYSFPPVRKIGDKSQIRLAPAAAADYRMREYKYLYDEPSVKEYCRNQLQSCQEAGRNDGRELYGFTCAAANSSCWITWQGQMLPCAMLPEPYTHPFRDGFLPAWNELKEKCDQIRMSPKCTHCAKRRICGVCPAANYTETGSYEQASSFHCAMTEEMLELCSNYLEEKEIEET